MPWSRKSLSPSIKTDLDTITHACVCGNYLWRLYVTFEDYEIATYLLDMECADCGNLAVAPTPIDRPGYEKEYVTV